MNVDDSLGSNPSNAKEKEKEEVIMGKKRERKKMNKIQKR